MTYEEPPYEKPEFALADAQMKANIKTVTASLTQGQIDLIMKANWAVIRRLIADLSLSGGTVEKHFT